MSLTVMAGHFAVNDSEFTTWRDRLGNGTDDVGDLIDEVMLSSEYLARFY